MVIVYKTINIVNGRYYIGVHKSKTLQDDYLGSGKAIKNAIKHYGKNKFIRENMYVFADNEELLAYEKEKELVSMSINDPLCYNLMEGGHGSFTVINKNRHLYTNPMKIPEIAKKNILSRKLNETEESKNKKADVCRNNIKKAIQYNTGRKRPAQSDIMKSRKVFAQAYDDIEKYRDILASWFLLTSPDGYMFKTNRLEDFCRENKITYVSVWNSSRTGVPVTKGRSKGWLCQKITQI